VPAGSWGTIHSRQGGTATHIADTVGQDIADRLVLEIEGMGRVQGGGLPPPALTWEGVANKFSMVR
jgi:hypothetical protein